MRHFHCQQVERFCLSHKHLVSFPFANIVIPHVGKNSWRRGKMLLEKSLVSVMFLNIICVSRLPYALKQNPGTNGRKGIHAFLWYLLNKKWSVSVRDCRWTLRFYDMWQQRVYSNWNHNSTKKTRAIDVSVSKKSWRNVFGTQQDSTIQL